MKKNCAILFASLTTNMHGIFEDLPLSLLTLLQLPKPHELHEIFCALKDVRENFLFLTPKCLTVHVQCESAGK